MKIPHDCFLLRRGMIAIMLLLVGGLFLNRADGVEIPFNLEERIIFLKGAINGEGSKTFILDTGATETIIIPSIAQMLGIKGFPIGGGQAVATVDSISAGQAVVRNLPVYIFDPPQALSLKLDHGIDYHCILGRTFLSQFVTTIDYHRKILSLTPHEKETTFEKPQDKYTSNYKIPFELVGGHIHTKVLINGKGPFSFVFDTGSAETIVIPATARALGMKGQAMAHPKDAMFTVAESISVGDANLSGVSVVIHTPAQGLVQGIDYDGILGYSFLSRFMITIDYRKRILVLSPYPEPSVDGK